MDVAVMLFWLWVGLRIVANPLSNVCQKSLTHQGVPPLVIIALTHGLLSLACLPILCFGPIPDDHGFWRNMAVCTALNLCGNAMLVQALKLSDLSVLGPINAYKSVVSLLPGMVVLGEVPGLPGLAGMALIVGGSYFLTDRRQTSGAPAGLPQLLRNRGIQLRLAALVFTAVEAIYFKQALLVSSPLLAFAWWSVFGFAASLPVVIGLMLTGRVEPPLRMLQARPTTFLLLFATTGTMQLCTTLVLYEYPVSYAFALFQTSAILSVVLGYQVFQEAHFARRLLGSAVMVAGAGLIILTQ